ncbi:MAG: sigma 54-interacting transcriptional regulator [Planctomycetota bacterium]
MNRFAFRRSSALMRIKSELDGFYMSQQIDQDYDSRAIMDRILGLAFKELEFGEGKAIDRGLLIVRRGDGEPLEVTGGWKAGEDSSFSRTVVERTLTEAVPVLYGATNSSQFYQSVDSLRDLPGLSLVSVPILSEDAPLGAIYVERQDAAHPFNSEDQNFLGEFAATIAPYVKTALLHQQHMREIRSLQVAAGSAASTILGRSEAMRAALQLATLAAASNQTVLITGESGSGKELFARAIHQRSPRAKRAFVIVDCSGLSENLLESELFGHKRGAFTGALTDKPGAFEEASGGTLFLDEICDSSLALQQKLRRVLQEGEIRRVGESVQRPVDVRVICATNRNLQVEVEQKRFIQDLYHRIHKFPIQLPPLRERKDDIPILADQFIAEVGVHKRPPVRAIEPEALARLVARDWRANNVRELRNVVELAVALASSAVIDDATMLRTFEIRGEVPARPVASAATASDRRTAPLFRGECMSLDADQARQLFALTSDHAAKEERPYYHMQREFSGKLIIEALRYTDWRLRPAAKLLGVSPVKLRQDLRGYVEFVSRCSETNDAEELARTLAMPADALRKKLQDLSLPLPCGGRTEQGGAN